MQEGYSGGHYPTKRMTKKQIKEMIKNMEKSQIVIKKSNAYHQQEENEADNILKQLEEK